MEKHDILLIKQIIMIINENYILSIVFKGLSRQADTREIKTYIKKITMIK